MRYLSRGRRVDQKRSSLPEGPRKGSEVRVQGEVIYKLRRFLLRADEFTTIDAAEFTGLDRKELHRPLQRLIEKGVVKQTGELQPSPGGRRPLTVYRVPRTQEVLSGLQRQVRAFESRTGREDEPREIDAFRQQQIMELYARAAIVQGAAQADLLRHARRHIGLARKEESLDPVGVESVAGKLDAWEAMVELADGEFAEARRLAEKARSALASRGESTLLADLVLRQATLASPVVVPHVRSARVSFLAERIGKLLASAALYEPKKQGALQKGRAKELLGVGSGMWLRSAVGRGRRWSFEVLVPTAMEVYQQFREAYVDDLLDELQETEILGDKSGYEVHFKKWDWGQSEEHEQRGSTGGEEKYTGLSVDSLGQYGAPGTMATH